MIQAVRDDLKALLPSGPRDNLSLLFNRLCLKIDEGKETGAKDDALGNLVRGYSEKTYKLYSHAFRSWQRDLENDPAVVSFTMITSAPLVVGVGEQNVHEFGITLQTPWATPVIPGSAVKGVASTFAHSSGGGDWHKGILADSKNGLSAVSGKHALSLFGGLDEGDIAFAGLVDFFPAWWMPTSKSPFMEDIINVHNRNYYQGGAWPDGTDSPVPNKFIVIKPGESFLFALRGPADWAELSKKILQQAAEHQGFGAKTRLGYGRLMYCKSDTELCADIPGFSNQELAVFFAKHHNNRNMIPALKQEVETRDYAPELKKLFRQFQPVTCFLADLKEIAKPDWKNIKNMYDSQYKKSLKSIELDPGQSDVREVYKFCRNYVPDPMPDWLKRFAPTAMDFLAGKNADEILDFLGSWEQAEPTLNDFVDVIRKLDLVEDDKELCLLELDEQRSRLKQLN